MTKRIRSSTAQVSIHPIGKALLADQLTCYPCRRSILLPMLPVWTAGVCSPSGEACATAGSGPEVAQASRISANRTAGRLVGDVSVKDIGRQIPQMPAEVEL